MAEKEKPKKESKEPEAPASEKAPAKGGGGLMTKTPILLGGVMLIEAVVLFAGFKFIGGGAPRNANGADLVDGSKTANGATTGPTTQDSGALTEVNLVDFKALNKLSGHSYLYDVRIDVTTKPEFSDRVTQAIKDRDGLIKDRVRTIIAELDPDKLGGGSEPGLETLKRQVKYQLDEMLGDGLIEEVLVPRCIPLRMDF
jgi:flagellar basal body-associated protein FliL